MCRIVAAFRKSKLHIAFRLISAARLFINASLDLYRLCKRQIIAFRTLRHDCKAKRDLGYLTVVDFRYIDLFNFAHSLFSLTKGQKTVRNVFVII